MKEVSNNCIDDFKIGPALTIGRSLLLLGRYREAQQYLGRLAVGKHHGSQSGPHFTYAGIAYWLDGNRIALRVLESRPEAGYQSHDWIGNTLDTSLRCRPPARLLLAPRCAAIDSQGARRLKQCRGRVAISAYVLQEQSYDATLKKLSSQFRGPLYRNSPLTARLLAEFPMHIGLLCGCARTGRRRRRSLLPANAGLRIDGLVMENIPSELIIAELRDSARASKMEKTICRTGCATKAHTL